MKYLNENLLVSDSVHIYTTKRWKLWLSNGVSYGLLIAILALGSYAVAKKYSRAECHKEGIKRGNNTHKSKKVGGHKADTTKAQMNPRICMMCGKIAVADIHVCSAFVDFDFD